MARKNLGEMKNIESGIYQDPDTGAYMVRVQMRPLSPRTRTVVGDIWAARKARDHLHAAMLAELALKRKQKVNPETTLAAYAEHWVREVLSGWRHNSQEAWLQVLGHHVLPVLGHIKLGELHQDDIRSWVRDYAQVVRQCKYRRRRENRGGVCTDECRDDCQRTGRNYADATLVGWWTKLTRLVNNAMAEGRTGNDPLAGVQPPRNQETVVVREHRTLSPQQFLKALEGVRLGRPNRYAEVCVDCFTGVRAGELFSLRWVDVGERTNQISVRRSVDRKGTFSAVKTRSPRDIVVPALVVEALQAHREWLRREGMQVGEFDLCFPSQRGTARTSSSLAKVWAFAREYAGIPGKLGNQVMRRTYNTLSGRAGNDKFVTQSMMGHASDAMMALYSGITYEQKIEAANRFESFLAEHAERPQPSLVM
ncbi:MAG: site-specific integrase [Myxococcota bacterium]|jgi:integrase|nr:site-specific integrase [Myxococcota bacterium]